jgi:hypothetical protein
MRSDEIKRERKMKEKNRDSRKKVYKKTEGFLKTIFADEFGNPFLSVKNQVQN